MSVGWERAARRVDREAQARTERRERLRAGRSEASWARIEQVEGPCARCGVLCSGRFLEEDGEVCESCFTSAEIAAASAPATMAQRAVLVLLTVPGWGLSAVLWHALVSGGSWWAGRKSLVAFVLLAVFALGWGLWTAVLGGWAAQIDVDRGQLDARTAVAGLALGSGGLAACAALGALLAVMA